MLRSLDLRDCLKAQEGFWESPDTAEMENRVDDICRPNPERKAYEAYVRMVAPICEKTRDSVPLCKDVAVDVSLAVREGREWLCIQGRVGMQTVRHLHALAFEDGLVWLVCKSKIECRHTEVYDILGVRTDARIRDVLVCCLEAALNLPQWRGVV